MSKATAGLMFRAAIVGVAITAAACRPTPTPTQPPSPTSSATPTRPPAERPSPTRKPAPTSTPTATPSAIEDFGPAAVSLTLADARAVVLGWLDPTRDPRIEAVRYLRRSSDLRDVLGRSVGPSTSENLPNYGDLLGIKWTPVSALPPILIAVIASTRGIDTLYAQWRLGTATPGADAHRSIGESGRETQLIALDAGAGELLVSTLVDPDVAQPWLASQATVDVILTTPLPTATPSRPTPTARIPPPTPTRPTSATRLTSANMPPALRSTFAAYPLRPGSSWDWRLTRREGGVRWSSSIASEVITDAWILGPDIVLVEAEVSERAVLAPSGDLGEPVTHTLRRYVTPQSIFGDEWETGRSRPPQPITFGDLHAPQPAFDLGGISLEPAFAPLEMGVSLKL